MLDPPLSPLRERQFAVRLLARAPHDEQRDDVLRELVDLSERLRRTEHAQLAAEPPVDGVEIRQISGGLLMQERDSLNAPGDDPAGWTLAAGAAADAATLADLRFAWRTCRAECNSSRHSVWPTSRSIPRPSTCSMKRSPAPSDRGSRPAWRR